MISAKAPFILYGGDYNPDQWPENVWKEDMRLFKLSHINLVTLPVFSWAKLQPSEDVYDFAWLDRVMDMLAENGIYACLATSTAAQPAWMSRKYPEILPVDVQGRKRTHGKRVNFCPNSPVYRHFAAQLAGKLAQRYQNHPALLIWHVANEYGTYCYCDRCASEFRKWVKNKYGTIEDVNRCWNLSFWGHTVYEWEDITVPSELNDEDKWYSAIALDYDRFMTDSSLGCYQAEYDAIKAVTPDIPVTTNISGYLKKLDQFQFARHVDIVGWDNYPAPTDDMSVLAFKHDLMRGLKNGKPYMLVEQSPNQQNWQPYNKLKGPGEVRRLSWQAIAHGAESILYFQLRQSVGGVEKLHGALISHAGHEHTRVFAECARLGAELQAMGDTLLDAEYRAKVAIVFDWDNWWAVELSSGPSRDLKYFDQAVKYYKALFEHNIAVDLIRPDADLSDYKIVILPLLYMVKGHDGEGFEKFVQNGGLLVTSFFSGIVDENDNVVLGGYPGRLKKMLGIWVEETDGLLPGEHNEIRVTSPTAHIRGSYACGLLCDLVNPEGARTIAEYGCDFYAGRPCVTANRFGKGTAYYVATDPEPRFLTNLVEDLADQAGLKPPVSAPPGVEVTRRYKAGKQYTFLLNHNQYACSVQLDSTYRDMLHPGEISGTITIGQSDVMVLESSLTP